MSTFGSIENGTLVKKPRKLARSVNSRRGRKASPNADKQLALAVLMKFRVIVNLAKRHFKWVEKQCGINGAQLWVLWEINQAPGLRVSELSAAMAMHQSTASNLIVRLARSKLIARKRASSRSAGCNVIPDRGRQGVTQSGAATCTRTAPRGIVPASLGCAVIAR